LNNRASMCRFWPVYVLQHPERQTAPVFVNDVASAIVSSLRTNDAVGTSLFPLILILMSMMRIYTDLS